MLRPPTPLPPALPSGTVRAIPGRGEFFVRHIQGPPDALPVLLIHGWQATADLNFFPLYEDLGSAHPVFAADLRGHGRSVYPETPFTIEDAADDHAAILRDAGVDRAIVVGYSIGSAITQMLVARHPALVAGIVLAGGELQPRVRPHEKAYLRAGGWQGTAQRITSGRWFADRIVRKASKENPVVEVHRDWLVAEMERGHPGSMRAAARALGRFDGTTIAERHHLPAVVIVTRRDKAVRPARQDRLADAWRATTLDLDADHDAPLAQADAFGRCVLEAVELLSRSQVDPSSPLPRTIGLPS